MSNQTPNNSVMRDRVVVTIANAVFKGLSIEQISKLKKAELQKYEELADDVMSLITEAETKAVLNIIDMWNEGADDDTFVAMLQKDYPWLAALKETHEETPMRKYNHKNKGVGTTHFDGDDCDPLGHPKGFYS